MYNFNELKSRGKKILIISYVNNGNLMRSGIFSQSAGGQFCGN